MTLMEEIIEIIRIRTGIAIYDLATGKYPTVDQQKELIQIVQNKVGRFYEANLDSSIDAQQLAASLRIESESMGIPADLLAAYKEQSVSEVVQTLHMICTIQSWFAQRILMQFGFTVYGVDVAETTSGEQECHVALLCSLADGSYYLVDSACPDGSGQIPSDIIKYHEVEMRLKANFVFEKDLRGSRLHRKIRVLHFESALMSWIFGNLACLLSGYADVLRQNDNKTDALTKYQESIAVCEKALERNPKKVSVWNILGYAYGAIGELYQEMGDSERAAEMYKYEVESYKGALKINSRYEHALKGLSFVHEKLTFIYPQD